MIGNIARTPYGAPLGQPAGGSGGGGGGTLAQAYTLGSSAADSTLTLDAGAGGLILDGTGIAVDPITVKNGLAGSGYVAQVTGSARTGYVLANSSGTKKAAFGLAVSAGDWITATAAGDVVVAGDSTTKLDFGFLAAATPVMTIDGATGKINIIRFNNAGVNTSSFLVSAVGTLTVNGHSGISMQSGATVAITVDPTTRNVIAGATGSDANNARLSVEKGSVVSTSGTQRSEYTAATFAPTSGTAVFRACEHAYTVNQTGGANGTVTGLMISATETAVVGTHNLLDLRVGAASLFAVTNAGKTVYGSGATALGGGAPALLGTVGGAGPANLAQNSWLKINIAGVGDCFLPVWN